MAQDIGVFGLYRDRESLDAAVSRLRAAHFRESDVSVLVKGNGRTHELGHELHSKAPEGAATGAAVGGAAGGAAALLLSLGELAIPGVGPLLAAGPIVATLAGIGAGGATGGLVGGLIGTGVPEVEAKLYEGRLRDGAYLCAVHCDDREWARRARGILKDAGGEHVAMTREAEGDYHP
jgi:hypothetical protein